MWRMKEASDSAQNMKSVRRSNGEDIRENLRSTREQIFYFLVIVLFVLISVYVDRDRSGSNYGATIPVNDGWMAENGVQYSLNTLPEGDVSLDMDVSGIDVSGKALCFKSIDTNFEVLADGQSIYTYHPAIPKRLGLSYGMYIHTVAIPEGTKRLTLQLNPIFSGTSADLTNAVITEGSQYVTDLFRVNLFAFWRSSVTMLVGLLFLLIGLFGRVLMKFSGLDFISLGVLCILLGFTGFNDTMFLQVLTGHPAIVRVVTYICLIFLPFPAMSFLAGTTGQGHSGLVSGALLVCLVNFGLQVSLTYNGISDYFHMVYVSHGIIVAAFVASIYLMIRAIRQRTISTELLRSLVIGLSACVIGAGLDIFLYYTSQSNGSSGYTRMGVVIFTVLMGIYLFRTQIRALNQKQRDNKIFISELSEAFAKVIDMKDSYTNGHSSRVAKYTAMLARELGCDEETVEKYYRIALLHDIGKIGVPPEVLNKPGKLTDEEFEIIKSHTSRGYEALKGISIMPELAIGAQAHHERPDGRGYPNRLKGDAIPRVAQIIAVTDCFDAMYSDRPYRKRMNFDKVVSIIEEVSGTQLAPDVVEAFMKLVEKGELRAPDDHGGGSLENIENIRGEMKE